MTGLANVLQQNLSLEGYASPVDLGLRPGALPGQYTIFKPSSVQEIGHVVLPPESPVSVSLYEGKGGLCSVVGSPSGAVYIGLPGSTIALGDVEVCLLGDRIAESNVSSEAGAISAAEIQAETPHAIILGAGLATRFERLSGETTGYSKPAVPLVGNTSVIGAIAGHLASHGFTQIFINTYFKRESLKESLSKVSGVTLHYLDEPEPSGTAGGLRTVLANPQQYAGYLSAHKPVLVVQGDAVTDADFSALMRAHLANNAAVTIGCMVKPDEDVDKFGIVATDGSGPDGQSGRIVRFMEKPTLAEAGPHRMASTGFYIFSPQTFPVILQAYEMLRQKTGQESPAFDFAMDVFPEILKRCQAGQINDEKGRTMPFWAQVVTGYWSDIGNPTQYIQTVRDIAAGKVKLPTSADCHLFVKGDIVYWPGAEVLSVQDHARLEGNVVVTVPYKL